MRKILPLYKWILIVAILIMTVSLFFSAQLTKQMAQEEKKKMQIWAQATQNILNNDFDEFAFSIIADNKNIPVIVVDDQFRYISSRNIKEPSHNIPSFYRKKIQKLLKANPPIEISLGDGERQYILYDDSYTLKMLSYYPIAQWSIILLFILIVIWVFNTSREAEQNRIWVGLSKETAHQLGTPISSLAAWNTILQAKYPDDDTFNEIDKDLARLRVVTERFSKIGSTPELTLTPLADIVENAMIYMQKRTSNKIAYSFTDDTNNATANINPTLFRWVIENLCKNAIDAITGSGTITINVTTDRQFLRITVSDTGHGIDRATQKKIFSPGFTTKKRGWGLGLSLSKRIIEQYHKGKIGIATSTPGVGTTFYILIPKL